jgi:sigma-B regulation protein RsbU (phosphoserine phosphatase)
MPEVPGLTLAGFSFPAHTIGGDYFDILHVDADHLGLFIADVSGKGIPAALLTMMTRSYLRVCYPGESDPSRILSRLNELVLKDVDQRQYVTAMYAIHDTRSRELRISNAGHNPALILHAASGTIGRVHTKGRPLGIFPHAVFENSCDRLEAGDVFCLYTDGIPEAKNRRLETFGLDRLEDTLLSHQGGTAGEIADGILEAIRQFVGDAVQHDDLALIVLKASPR